MASSRSNTDLTSMVALLASPSRIDDMVSWVSRNISSLSGTTLLLSPRELKEKLQVAQQLALDSRMLSVNLEALAAQQQQDDDGVLADALVASKVLNQDVQGVVCFHDYQQSVPCLSFLARLCDKASIPLAFNEATADLCLRGIAKTRTVYLIFNPVAGKGEGPADLELIKSILGPAVILHVIMTEKDRNIADQAKDAIDLIRATDVDDDQHSMSILVASGGDGTVSAVAGCTMNTGIPLGVIPRGTANAFSVALGIPTQNVEEACRNILFGHVRVIDGGLCCNDIPFINLAGIGFEAGLVDNATRELKNAFGNLAYVLGGAKQALQQQKPFKCSITIDDQEAQTIETDFITVANVAPPSSVFAQGFGEVIPDDGLFEITVGAGTNAWESLEGLASLWISSVVKKPSASDKILYMRAKTLSVDCDASSLQPKLLLDGEVLQRNKVIFQVIPNGLHVITPMPENEKKK